MPRLPRLLGLDRSGPAPPQTLSGQPLHPLTLPNLIGLVRLALVPVFLALVYRTAHGHDALAVVLFGVIAWSDYFDGLAARLTGQYSRFGALLDPITDRLLIVAGAVACWSYHLLPRWALAVLAARELFMLVASQAWLRRRLEIQINWLGRAAVWPLMSALFFALADLSAVGRICLYVGLALAWLASAKYLYDGRRELRRASAPAPSPASPGELQG